MDASHRGADLDELRAFEAVARLGTVGAAADELDRAQPSISGRLASLEEAWRTRLFVRRSRGMELTPEGRRLLGAARAVLEAARALDHEAGLPLVAESTVRLGSGDALGRGLVPRALRRLLDERPGVSVRVREGSGDRLERDLREGAIDVALLPAREGGGSPGLRRERLLESAVEVLLPPGLAPRRRRVRPEDLADRALVLLLPGSSFRRRIEAAWAERGLDLRVAVEVGSYSLVRRFVGAGLGPAPVPAAAFAGEEPRGDAVERRPLEGAGAYAWDAAVREGVPLASSAARLLDLLQAEARRRAE
jgi:DNA-binding transcriptional LysR family regulator